MKSTLSCARFSGESNVRTYVVSVVRNVRSASGVARVGCAAMSHEGQGVGTEPICPQGERKLSGRAGKGKCTHETSFASIDERLGGEPLPHERAG